MPQIEELLKQLLDEVVSNRSSMAHVEELKSATDGSMKRIEAVEKKMEASPPPLPPPLSTYPPPSGRATMGKSPPTAETMVDLTTGGSNLLH
jgi:hypothetical protein